MRIQAKIPIGFFSANRDGNSDDTSALWIVPFYAHPRVFINQSNPRKGILSIKATRNGTAS
jgi:hypothetical protein